MAAMPSSSSARTAILGTLEKRPHVLPCAAIGNQLNTAATARTSRIEKVIQATCGELAARNVAIVAAISPEAAAAAKT